MGGCRRVRVAAGRMGGGMAHAGPASIVRVPASHAQPMAPTHPPMIVQVDTYMTRVLQCLRLLPHITDIEVSAGGRKRRMRTPSAPALPCGATRAHTPTRPPTRPPTHAPPHTRARADGLWRPDRSQGPWFAITQAPEEVAQHLAAASGGAAVKPEPGGGGGGFGGGGGGGEQAWGGVARAFPCGAQLWRCLTPALAGTHLLSSCLPPTHPPRTRAAEGEQGAAGGTLVPGTSSDDSEGEDAAAELRAAAAAVRQRAEANGLVRLCFCVCGGGGVEGARANTRARAAPSHTSCSHLVKPCH